MYKKQLKKFTFPALVALTALCLAMSGCGKQQQEERYPISIMTYSYYAQSPLTSKGRNEIMDKVETYTNTDLDIRWVSSTNYSQKLSTVLTYSKDMPMIVATDGKSSSVLYAARNGLFWDLTDLLDDYPNLSRASKEINNNILIDGRMYGVSRCRELGRVGVSYRADWAESLGLEAPESIDALEKMIRSFTWDDPDGNGIDDTYGLVLSADTDPNVLDAIMVWFGVPNKWGENDKGELIPAFSTDEYMTALDWLRKMYKEGCINADFYIRDAAHWSTEIKNGRAGVLVRYVDEGRRAQVSFEHDGLDWQIGLLGAVEGYDGKKRTLATSGYNGFFAITKAASTLEDVRKCLDFLDKLNDPEMMLLLDNGLEGRHYVLNEQGEIVRSTNLEQNLEYNDLNQLLTYSPYYQSPLTNLYQTGLMKRQYELYQENRKYCIKDPTLPFLQDSPAYMENGEVLDQMLEDARIRYIIGEIDKEELRQIWANWHAQGGSQLIEELNALYKIRKQ